MEDVAKQFCDRDGGMHNIGDASRRHRRFDAFHQDVQQRSFPSPYLTRQDNEAFVALHVIEQMSEGVLMRLAPVHEFCVRGEPEGTFVEAVVCLIHNLIWYSV
jgi:hypothetical protein